MLLTKEQIRIGYYALLVDSEGKAKTFDIPELQDASFVFTKFNESTNDDKEKTFKDGDFKFTTTQKTLLLKNLQRKWSAIDGVHVLALIEKLEK